MQTVRTAVFVVTLILVLVPLFGALTALLWNFVLHGLFDAPQITWLHGVAINIMLAFVGNAFRGHK